MLLSFCEAKASAKASLQASEGSLLSNQLPQNASAGISLIKYLQYSDL